jgi:formate dehydrogenase beta subunit
MSDAVIVDTSRLRGGRGIKARPKGRHVNPEALADVQMLLGDTPRERSLLIEFLHRIQDARGYLPASYLVALAQEMKLSMTEVYEVATFYHHFDIVDGDEAPPPPITVRVCETLSCRMAGADALRAALLARGDANVRVLGAPCIGRCEQAPAAVVGRNPVDRATLPRVLDAIAAGAVEATPPAYTDLAAYRGDGGYRTLVDCIEGRRSVDAVIA